MTGRQPDRLDSATRWVGLTVVLGSVMSMLDTTSVNVALHDLAGDFGVSVTEVHWVASAYLLALAVAIPLSGWASARFGGRRVWMTSVSIFLTGSILAGISWSLGSLIAFRILQGFGGGMILPVGMAMLVGAAGTGRVGRALGILGIAQLLGPVLGPVLGGLLVQDGGWRWIFYVNVPIGALALVLAARHLPTHPPDRSDRLDLRGFALLAPGLAGLVYGLASISNGGAAGVRAFVPMLAGIALVAAFVIHALRVSNPLIDVRLFGRRAYAATAGTALCLGMNLFGAMFLLPLYYQSVRGQGALDAGLLIAPQGIGAAMMMPFSGRATDRFGPGRVVPLGLALLLLGTLPFAFADASTPYPLLAGALVLRGLGIGASMMPAMAGASAALGDADTTRGVSAINTLQRMGGSLGVALAAVVLAQEIAGGAADAFGPPFWWILAVGALAFVPAAFLPRHPTGASTRQRVPIDRTPSRIGSAASHI
jgi:EmrB/QacA subfamily drug resistance transporter